jgi:hypothetical protein
MRHLVAVLSVIAAWLTACAAASAATNVQVQTSTATAPATMPILFAGTQAIYGHRVDEGDPIPAGTAVVTATFTAAASGPTLFTLPCPSGTAATDFGERSIVMAGGFDAPLGERVMQMRFFPPRSGPLAAPQTVHMLCQPLLSPSTRNLGHRDAPVTFPNNIPFSSRVAKGSRLRRGQRLMRSTVRLTKGEAAIMLLRCPKRLAALTAAVATRGVHGMSVGDDAFGIVTPRRSGRPPGP